ncbi:MAG: hypothetical protein ACFFD4_07890 [Candidatus Odinarchaeota archaeon]
MVWRTLKSYGRNVIVEVDCESTEISFIERGFPDYFPYDDFINEHNYYIEPEHVANLPANADGEEGYIIRMFNRTNCTLEAKVYRTDLTNKEIRKIVGLMVKFHKKADMKPLKHFREKIKNCAC